MAISFVSSVRSMADKLVAAIKGSPSSSTSSSAARDGVEEDLKKLQRTLLRIQAVLYDAEEREIRDLSVKLWLKELKGVAYDAEDVLDDYQYELLRSQAEGGAEASRKRKREDEDQQVCELTSALACPSVLDGLADRIREIRGRFDEISKDREALHLREGDGVRRDDVSMSLVPTSSHVDESRIVGRKGEKEKLIDMLLSDEGSAFSVVAVVGMGGLGKTTLAKLVYNDWRVQQHFNSRGWVCVSEDFDVAGLTREIIESITWRSCDTMQLNALQDTLKENLKGKRVLLVLDDIWNQLQSPWESLKAPFAGAEIVRVIVTTRDDSVAKIMQTVPTYRLGYLSEEECWRLFRRHAFDGRRAMEQPNLIEIGKKIIRKCGGLPLAVKTLGGFLRYETDEDRWRDILESDLWELDESKNEILPALRLSYHRMPAHLKPCFLYSSMFPKDYWFWKDRVVKLWVAQSYVHPKGNRTEYDTGCEYFDELQRRSFFQKEDYSRVTIFLMHDMIHDLACSISGDECRTVIFKDDDKASDTANEVRHLYVGGRLQKKELLMEALPCNKPTALRTLIMREDNGRDFNIYDQFKNLSCLRALEFRCKEWPDSACNLKHLRFLRLISRFPIRLPESVSHLYNLQVLDLRYCRNGVELPRGITKLSNLRHLLLPDDVCLPMGIGNLSNLQELTTFNVVRSGSKHSVTIEEMKDLMGLSGELKIRGLKNVVSTEAVKEARLSSKGRLQKLTLDWNGGYCEHGYLDCGNNSIHLKVPATDDRFQDDKGKHFHMGVRSEERKGPFFSDEKLAEDTLEALQPHTNLTQLKIEGYSGSRFPKWVSDPSFSRLITVRLFGCSPGYKFLPPLGQLPSLKYLEVGFMNNVTRVGREFCCCYSLSSSATLVTKVGFPSLEVLEFWTMAGWKEWRDVPDGDFPRLRKLTIDSCNKLRELPTLPSLLSFSIDYCNDLRSLCLHQNPKRPCMLQSLYIFDCKQLTSLVGLHNLESLEVLEVRRCPDLQRLGKVLPSKLQTVRIYGCMKLNSLMGLQNLAALKTLELRRCLVLLILLNNIYFRPCLKVNALPTA